MQGKTLVANFLKMQRETMEKHNEEQKARPPPSGPEDRPVTKVRRWPSDIDEAKRQLDFDQPEDGGQVPEQIPQDEDIIGSISSSVVHGMNFLVFFFPIVKSYLYLCKSSYQSNLRNAESDIVVCL